MGTWEPMVDAPLTLAAAGGGGALVVGAALAAVAAAVAFWPQDERADVYRAACASCWSDGVLAADERAMLDTLRAELGLAPGIAAGIEAEVRPH